MANRIRVTVTLGDQEYIVKASGDDTRCRYCVDGESFLPMVSHLDGRYICNRCGHVEGADNEFDCNCGKCAEVRRFGRFN